MTRRRLAIVPAMTVTWLAALCLFAGLATGAVSAEPGPMKADRPGLPPLSSTMIAQANANWPIGPAAPMPDGKEWVTWRRPAKGTDSVASNLAWALSNQSWPRADGRTKQRFLIGEYNPKKPEDYTVRRLSIFGPEKSGEELIIAGDTGNPLDRLLHLRDEGIILQGARNVTIRDLTLEFYGVNAIKIHQDGAGLGSENITIDNCIFIGSWGNLERLFKVTDPRGSRSKNIRITRSLFIIQQPKKAGSQGNLDYVGALDIMGTDGLTVEDCTFIGVQGKGRQGRAAIMLWRDVKHVVLRNLRMIDCDRGLTLGLPTDPYNDGASWHVQDFLVDQVQITRPTFGGAEFWHVKDGVIRDLVVYEDGLAQYGDRSIVLRDQQREYDGGRQVCAQNVTMERVLVGARNWQIAGAASADDVHRLSSTEMADKAPNAKLGVLRGKGLSGKGGAEGREIGRGVRRDVGGEVHREAAAVRPTVIASDGKTAPANKSVGEDSVGDVHIESTDAGDEPDGVLAALDQAETAIAAARKAYLGRASASNRGAAAAAPRPTTESASKPVGGAKAVLPVSSALASSSSSSQLTLQTGSVVNPVPRIDIAEGEWITVIPSDEPIVVKGVKVIRYNLWHRVPGKAGTPDATYRGALYQPDDGKPWAGRPVFINHHSWGNNFSGHLWHFNYDRGALVIGFNEQPDGVEASQFWFGREGLQWRRLQVIAAAFKCDTSRQFVTGGSMGAGAAVFQAIEHPDEIAAVHATVGIWHYGVTRRPDKRETQWWDLLGHDFSLNVASESHWMTERIRAHPEVSLPLLVLSNGAMVDGRMTDPAIGWKHVEMMMAVLQETRQPHVFQLTDQGHRSRVNMPGRDEQANDRFGIDLRVDRSLPAFTNCSIDDSMTVNRYLGWETADQVDQSTRWEMTLWLARNAPEQSCTVDVTPRKLQVFQVKPGDRVTWVAGDQSGQVTADQWGLITIPAVRITQDGTRLRIGK